MARLRTTMLLVGLMAMIAVFEPPATLGQGHAPVAGTWTAKAPMPTPRRRAAAVALDGKIYVMGGYDSFDSGGALASVLMYDPTADVWSNRADMPGPKQIPGAAVVNGHIYVMGGPDPQTYEYTPSTDSWAIRSSLPVTPTGGAVAVIGGQILAAFNIAGNPHPQLYMYDPSRDVWEQRQSHPDERSIASLGVTGGMIYAVGGGIAGQVPAEPTRVDRYDPVSDTWTIDAISPLSIRRTHLGPTLPTIDGRMYVIGGWNGYSTLSSVEVYDPGSDTWTSETPMPTARYGVAYASVGSKIYAIGGDHGGVGGNWQIRNDEFTVHITQTAFFVGVDPQPSWRDLAALATVPAADRLNRSQPVVMLAPTDLDAEDRSAYFLAQYQPDIVYSVGITQRARILFDEAHNEWTSITGNYQAFADDLRGRGHTVDRHTAGLITEDLLASYHVLVVGTAWGDFTTAEIDVIQQFVSNGGGLFLTGLGWSWVNPDLGRTLENYPMNRISTRFDLRFLDDAICDPTSYYPSGNTCNPLFSAMASHPITSGLTTIGGPISPSPIGRLSSAPQAIVFGDDDAYSNGGHYPAGTNPPLVVAAEYGAGRVVVLGHEAYLSTDDYDGDGKPNRDDYDNARLGQNIIDWLTENATRPFQSIPGGDEFEVAAQLATRFWDSAETAVLVSHEQYPSALLGATLAARLDVPLLFVSASTVPSVTQSVLAALGSDSVLFVGTPSTTVLDELQVLGLATSVLPDAHDVTQYLTGHGFNVSYVVLTNPWDREYSGQVTKLSLLSPILAAYHDGVVYPKSVIVQYKEPFSANTTTNERPNGASQGGRQRLFPWSFATNPPARATDATWTVFPVDGHYASGRIIEIGAFSASRSFHLAASSSGGMVYDQLLLDLDRSDDYSDDEVFGPGDGFILDERHYWVTSVSGDGSWSGIEDFVELAFHTWAVGTFSIDDAVGSFAATCSGYGAQNLGFYDTVDLDLDGDGIYGEPGEGPYRTSDTITLGDKTFVLTVGTGANLQPMALKFTTPDAREIVHELRSFYAATAISPRYLALVGYYDAVPFALPIRPEAYMGVEDFASDLPYGQLDDDPFVDVAVGRVVASSVHNASLVVARSVVYADLLTIDWQDKALTLSGPHDQRAITKLAAHDLANVGFTTTHIAETEPWQDSYLQDRTVVFHFNHAGSGGWMGGPNASGVRALHLAPAVAMSGG